LGDWAKNLFVFPALLASGKSTEPEAIAAALIAFFAFSFTASGVYSINDALDWKTDRLHPVKRRRPIARGDLSPREGYLAGAAWLAAGFSLSFATGSWHLAVVLASYLVLQVLYNTILKRITTVDVVALSIGFVLRAWAGAVAIGVVASLWLLATVFCICLFLAMIKRLCDLSSMQGGPANGSARWHAAAGYQSVDELNWMLAVSAACSVITFLMYSLSSHAATGPGVRGLALLTPLVIVAMFRIYRAALRGTSDSPFAILTEDVIVIVCSALFAAVSTALLAIEPLGRAVDRLFGL
jgi:decaprenyl-phosphate phosphoribosyltransferase